MLPSRNLKKVIFLLLLILCLAEPTQALDFISLNPDGSHSNQNQINKALERGNVYLNPGVYEIDDNIILPSNRVLTGDPNAIIRVWGGSSAWFTGLKGVINCGNTVVHDVEISGFQIDGNIGSLPKSYANSRPDTDHDQQKLLILHGYSNQFASNITIRNMKLYNSFSDGIYILFGDHVTISNNFISNTQHEGFYISCVNYGLVYGNKIAGICSDCGRLDNCQNCKVTGNYFFSYNGESYGQYKGGQAGLQIANSGSSHGYDASKKPQKTDNVEVCFNVFADPGRQAIWLHNYDGSVFVHHNEFKGAEGLETLGIPVGDISVDNPPTVEMSEKVFSSIFDVLNAEFKVTGRTNQTSDEIPYTIQETEQGRIAGGIKIIGFKDVIYIDGVPYIPNNDSVLVKYNAVKAPSFEWNHTGVSKIDKEVDVKNENGNVTATLTVKMKWYKLSNDSTGTIKNKQKTSEAVFSDTAKAPQILTRPTELKGILYEYPTYSLASVPTNGLSEVEYEYNGKTADHVFLLGEQHKNNEGIIYTNFSKVDYWTGELNHSGEFLFINGSFNPKKLTVTAYTPYENFQVTRFDYVKKEFPVKYYADWLYPSFGLFLIIWIVAWYYIKKILY